MIKNEDIGACVALFYMIGLILINPPTYIVYGPIVISFEWPAIMAIMYLYVYILSQLLSQL